MTIFEAAVRRSGISTENAHLILGLSRDDFERMTLGEIEVPERVWARLSSAYRLHDGLLTVALRDVQTTDPSEEQVQAIAKREIGEEIPAPLLTSIMASIAMIRFRPSRSQTAH